MGNYQCVYTGSQIDEGIEKALVSAKQVARKFKPELNASPWLITTYGSNYVPKSQAEILTRLQNLKSMGVDSIIYSCHVFKNSEGQLYIAENVDTFNYVYTQASNLGLSITAVKFHCTYSVVTGYVGDFNADYKALLLTMCVAAQNKVRYFTVLNELPEVYFNASYQAFVIDLLQTATGYGFLTGVTFAGESDAVALLDNEWMLTYVDAIFINYYPPISFKGSKASIQDSKYAWEYLRTSTMLKNKYNKPLIISESGVQHFWECLSNPATSSWIGIAQTNSSGGSAYIYLYGMLNSDAVNENIDAVWIWYPEEMDYEIVYNLVNEYTGGVQ